VCCSVWQCVAVRGSALQCVAVRGSALQCVAVRGSALQCVAECCIETGGERGYVVNDETSFELRIAFGGPLMPLPVTKMLATKLESS